MICRGGQVVDALAVQFVGNADLQLVKSVQHIKLGQRDPGNPRGGTGLTHQNCVEPTAAALAPGCGAKFVAPFAQTLAVGVIQFGREWPLANPGGVGLDDTQHEIDGIGAQPGARRRLPGDHVRRGNIGIGTEIDVQKGALRPFKQDTFAGFSLFVQYLPDRCRILEDRRGDFQKAGNQRVAVDGVKPQPAAQRVVMHQRPVHPQLQRCPIGKVCDPDHPAPDLVFVGRADAAPGGADLGHSVLRFTCPVQLAMERQDQWCILGDQQGFRRDRHPLRTQPFDLPDQMPRVQNHPVADDRQLAATHNP